MRSTFGMCDCARTTTGIRQHADKEHQDPKARGETKLCELVDRLRILVFVCVIYVRKHMGAWVANPRAQPPCSDFM